MRERGPFNRKNKPQTSLFTPDTLARHPRLQEALNPEYVATELTTIGEHSPWTLEHSKRTGLVTDGLYDDNLPQDDSSPILAVRAALLHDVGKRGVRKEVLNKAHGMTDAEFAEIQLHVPHGVTILTPRDPKVAEIMSTHHRFQGERSYPGEAIPAESFDTHDPIAVAKLVVAVADVTDAAYSARPYKEPMDEAAVQDILEEKFGPYMHDLPTDLLPRAVSIRAELGR